MYRRIIEKPRKIGVVCFCGLGDLIYSLPGLLALREAFPEAKISLIVNEKTVLDLLCCMVHKFQVIDASALLKSRLTQKIKMIFQLRAEKYDVIISQAQPDTWRIPLMVGVLKGKVKIGGNNERLRWVYTRTVPIKFSDTHSTERFFKMVSCVIGKELIFNSWEDYNIKFTEDKKIASPQFELLNKKIALIVPGCAGKQRRKWRPSLKQWPVEKYRALVKELIKKKWHVLIVGTSNERDVCSAIEQECLDANYLHNLCGKTNLRELIDIIDNSEVVIGHDSGVTHLASMIGKHVIGLFGPTSPSQFGPKGKNVSVIWSELKCRGCYPNPSCGLAQCKAMEAITPEEVIEQVNRIIPEKTS